MFGTLGGPELFLILIVALIVFGPRKLPEMGKSLGKMMAEFRKASNDFQRTIEDEVEADRVKSATAAPLPAPEAALAPAAQAAPEKTVEHATTPPSPIEPK
jgi:Tat protein translocase TatB subunit